MTTAKGQAENKEKEGGKGRRLRESGARQHVQWSERVKGHECLKRSEGKGLLKKSERVVTKRKRVEAGLGIGKGECVTACKDPETLPDLNICCLNLGSLHCKQTCCRVKPIQRR